jgi:CheY-like chemotaxis protein
MHINNISPYRCKLAVLVDDNEIDGFITRSFIEKSGFVESLQQFTAPSKALHFLKNIFNENAFSAKDLFIFLDLHMPEFNGLAFLCALREINPSAISRVCILSSEYEEIQRKIIGDFSVAGFMSKPFNLEKLHELLNSNSSAALEA